MERTYLYGEEVTLTATPDECCEFLYWVEETNPCIPVSYDQVFSFVTTENTSYIPIFRKKQFRVEVTTNFPDFCCIDGNGLYDCGTDVTITITTSSCNTIEWANPILLENTEFEYNQINNTVTLTYTIESISNDFMEQIVLTLCHCTINVETCSPENTKSSAIIVTGSNTPNHNSFDYICNGLFTGLVNPCDYTDAETHNNTLETLCGTEVTLIATPDVNCEFLGWTIGNGCDYCTGQYVSQNQVFPIVLTEENITYIACFEEKILTII